MRRPSQTLAVLVATVALGVLWFTRQAFLPSATEPSTSTTSDVVASVSTSASPVSPASRRLAPASLQTREYEAVTIGRFDSWAAAYCALTDPAARRAAVPAGLLAASARREVLRDLIASDPERALRHAVPWGVRRALPTDIQALLEERVDGIGTYHALASLPPSSGSGLPSSAIGSSATVSGPRAATRREVALDGRTYEAFTYGRRLALGSRSRLAVHGIALDGRLALLDGPVRALDTGEPVVAGRRIEELCAVSGQTTSAESPVAADTGDRVIYLCSAGHISILASHLEAGESQDHAQDGDGDSASSTSTSDDEPAVVGLSGASGARRVVMLRIRFADQSAPFAPETDASAAAMFAAADAFYQENSFGALRIEGTVSPVYTLPQTAAWYSANDSSGYALNILLAARAVAADPASAPGNDGLPPTNYLDYDFEVVRYTSGPGTFSGQGYVAMRGCWLKSPDAGVLIHELGHNLGLWHANAWIPADPLVPLGPGSNAEYGDTFDTMGPARGGSWHFNAWEKRRLGWLAPTAIATASGASTTVALAVHDLGASDVPPSADTDRALRIRRDDDRDYWVEFRRHPGWLATRPGVHDGVTLRWDPWARSNGGTQLIDATPGSPAGRDDATLAVGQTFSDLAAGIHITPVAVNSIGDLPGMELDVRIGDFSANRRPAVSAASSTAEAAPGQPVQFSATATDPDGDALSFTWTFDDSRTAVPGSDVTHAWSSSGDYRARVTVTDRRGGTASASVLVRVGAASGSRITGRVLDLAGQPVPDVLVHNDTEPGADAYRSATSDADGTFTLLGVPEGTWHLAATAPGWIFAVEGFSRPVSTPQDTGDITLRGHWRGFSVSGVVRRADGSPLPGVLVRLGERLEPTDQFGEFQVTGVSPGRHVLTVESTDAAFAPATIEVGLGDVDTVYLVERTFTISGTINGDSLDGATVTTGWQSTSVPAASSGSSTTSRRYSLSGIPAGTWALRAVSSSATFSPDGFDPPVVVDDDTAGLVLATDATPRFAIGGVVRDRGFGLAGVTVSVPASGLSTVTDSRGGYWLAGLAPGTHEVTVTAAALAFSPATRSVTIAATHVTDIDFVTDRTNQAPTLDLAPRAVGPADQPFIALAAAATDDESPDLLRYWWSVIGDTPGEVTFAANGAHAAGDTVARFSAPGSYRLRLTAVDRHGAEQSGELLLDVRGGSGPPVISEPARADPAVVGAALSTRLTVRATSERGDSGLTYTWSTDAGAPGPVVFSTNASASARDTIATFRSPGNYLLRVTVRDPAGHAVESSVAVRVELTFASWLSAHFDPAIVADPSLRAGLWGELADPDADGIANLLEYAFGGDPFGASPDTRPRTHFVTEGGVEYLAVTFRPNPDAIDLTFEPQVSSDLETWHPGLIFIPGPDERLITYRDFAPAAAHQRRFIRVHVSDLP